MNTTECLAGPCLHMPAINGKAFFGYRDLKDNAPRKTDCFPGGAIYNITPTGFYSTYLHPVL